MKKLLTVLCGILVALSLFVTTGNTAKAAEPDVTQVVTEDDGCGCHNLLPLTGVERNKIVAKFISSDEFKAKKTELLKSGFTWNGAHTVEVILPEEGVTMVGVPFFSADGVPTMYVFINGVFVGTAPVE